MSGDFPVPAAADVSGYLHTDPETGLDIHAHCCSCGVG